MERQINSEIQNAVANAYNYSKGNTAVIVKNGTVGVLLHGNVIYKRRGSKEMFTLAGFETTVTKNRLRAIGIELESKNGQTYYKGEVIDKNKWYEK